MGGVELSRAHVVRSGFTPGLDQSGRLPYGLQQRDFQNAMESLYDFFHSINSALMQRGIEWIENTVRAAAVSNMISDLTAAAMAKYSYGLVENQHHNGHPDLIPHGMYPNDSVKAGEEGVEIKSTRGRVADTHGARNGWVCQFNYKVDSEPIIANRRPTIITFIYLAQVTEAHFRRNERLTERGTHTSTLDRSGLALLRQGVVYQHPSM